MNPKRLLTLQACLLVGLGSVFLLPKKIEIQPAAIGKELPTFVGEWYGADQPNLQGEKESLGPDTQFARKLYTNARGDQIFVSIVVLVMMAGIALRAQFVPLVSIQPSLFGLSISGLTSHYPYFVNFGVGRLTDP